MPPTRRQFIQASLLLGAGCELDGGVPSADAPPLALREGQIDPGERPDIVFISIDDLNDWPSPFSGPKPTTSPADIITPNMERIAAEGTTFQRAYCAAPMCGPSRSATLTGLPPHVSGVTEQEHIFDVNEELGPLLVNPDSIVTLPELLHDAGYRTYGAGKVFHAGYSGNPSAFPACGDDGVDPWHERYRYCAWDHYEIINHKTGDKLCLPPSIDTTIAKAIRDCPGDFDPAQSLLPDAVVARYGCERLAEELGEEAPMFLALGFFKPHIPWQAPAEFYDLYPLDHITLLDGCVEKLDQSDLTFPSCVTLRDARQSPGPDDWDQATRQAAAAYLASVTYIDSLLGQVLDAAFARKRRTLIVLWSDHGYFMGEKRNWKKPSLYERATRVPLMILDTGNPQSQSTHALASLMDVMPTVLDYAEVEIPDTVHGRSLRPLVEDASCPWDQTSVVTTFNFRRDFSPGPNKIDLHRCLEELDVTVCPGPFSKQACPEPPTRLDGASFALRVQSAQQQLRYVRHGLEHELFWSAPSGTGPTLETRELYDLEQDPRERHNLLAPENWTPKHEQLAQALDAELQAKLELS